MNIPSKEQLQADIASLNEQMSDPSALRNGARLKELAGELNHKKELLEHIQQLEITQRQLAEAGTLAGSADEELKTLAQEEAHSLSAQQAQIQHKINELLVPRDPRDARDVILEIRAGAGGEEASLFAAELFRAYSRYAELAGWRVSILSQSLSEQGGIKEIVAEISGKDVFGKLKYERGVHRVQRVPETEKMGRVHTSTITVAVLPQAEEVDMEIRPEDLRVDTYRASGAGGQHVNKTSSAIRITHLPTGVVVACQEERSQHKNREKAMSLLRSRLLDAQEEERRKKEAQERKGQIGTGDRSEKIRTYNFPQDRVTDHRLKESWSNIYGVMAGELEPIFTGLKNAERELAL